MSAERIDQLTGLRFVAALGVVLCHYAASLSLPESTRFLTDFMGSGVALFFVLSGFVLTHTYETRLADPRAPGAWRAYIVARAARVLPVYWLCLALLLGLYGVFGFGLSLGGPADAPGKGMSFVINLLALQAWWPDLMVQQYWNAPGWSISSELFFYLLFPLLLRWRGLDGQPVRLLGFWMLMVVVLGAIAGIAVAQARHADPVLLARLGGWLAYTVRCPLLGLFCFVVGIHLARAHARDGGLGAPRGGAMAVATAAVVALAAFVSWQKPRHPLGFYVEISAIYLLYTPYFYLLIRYLLARRGALTAALARPRMVLLGDASYALYLLHWLPLVLLINGPAPVRGSVVWAWAALTGLILLSLVVYRAFEDPSRRRIRAVLAPGT